MGSHVIALQLTLKAIEHGLICKQDKGDEKKTDYSAINMAHAETTAAHAKSVADFYNEVYGAVVFKE